MIKDDRKTEVVSNCLVSVKKFDQKLPEDTPFFKPKDEGKTKDYPCFIGSVRRRVHLPEWWYSPDSYSIKKSILRQFLLDEHHSLIFSYINDVLKNRIMNDTLEFMGKNDIPGVVSTTWVDDSIRVTVELYDSSWTNHTESITYVFK